MVELTLEKKATLIEQVKAGKSHRKIAEEFGVSKSTVANIFKAKEKILNAFEQNCSSKRKRVCETKNDELNSKVLEFFVKCRSKNIPVSGPMLQEKAKIISESLNVHEFKASNGWLESFRQRNNIQCKLLSGESADANVEVSEDWKRKIPSLVAEYDVSDIFNADESGFFYRQLPTRTLVKMGESCKGGKKAKERITVLFCCSATGEKIKPMVIGNAARPRVFKQNNIDIKNLPVEWKSNKKAWMTGLLFTEWLKNLDMAMRRQKRKILLLVDNATSHFHQDFSNLKILFLPPNLTSEVQPLDRGIIQSVKLNYRRQMMDSLVTKAEECRNSSDFSKSITVLDAIRWIAVAWKGVSPITISKCFKQCGVTFGEIDIIEPDIEYEDPSFEDEFLTLSEVNSIEGQFQLHDDAGDDADVILHSVVAGGDASQSDDSEDDSIDESTPTISHKEALECAKKLVAFAGGHSPDLMEKMFHIQKEIEQHWSAAKSSSTKQTSITDFFSQS